jgi:hypothetical protein
MNMCHIASGERSRPRSLAVYTSSIAPNSKLSGQARVTLLQQKLLRCVDLYPFYEAVLWNRNSEIT